MIIFGQTSKRIVLIFLSIFLAAVPIFGQVFELPEGVYYHRMGSTLNGPEAAWINPAGLALYNPPGGQYISEFSDNKLNNNWGLTLTGDGVGISYRKLIDFLGDDYEEYIFSGALKLGDGFGVGMSYLVIHKGPEAYKKRHMWNLGIILRKARRFSYSAYFENLNRKEFNGEKTDILQVYTGTYRPFEMPLWFSLEMSLTSDGGFSEAKYLYGIDYKPAPGISVYGVYRDNDGFEIGVRLNLNKYFVGGQTRFDYHSDHIRTPLIFGYSSQPQSSILPPPDKK